MIVVEKYDSSDRDDLIRTYSDSGKYIIQDGTGAKYAEAVDPISTGRTYTESDEDIEEESKEFADSEIKPR